MVLPVSWWRWAKAKAIAAHAKPPLEKLPKGIPLPSFLKRWLTTVSSQLPYGGIFLDVEFPDEPPDDGDSYDFKTFHADSRLYGECPPFCEIYSLDICTPYDPYFQESIMILLKGQLTGQVWVIDELNNFYKMAESAEVFVNKWLLNISTN
jgi:hypothetical protein